METSSNKTIKKISRNGKGRLSAQPKKLQASIKLSDRYFSVPSDILPEYKKQKMLSLKRVSPFLLLGFFLVGLLPYMFITGAGTIHSTLLLLFVFAFLEINLLVFDFAIWNYFEGKKIFRIWLIEAPLTILVIHFLI